MNNEPVAIRYDFDGYGYQYMDSGSGSDWQTRAEGEFLYTHPVKEHDIGISHAIGFDDGFKAGMQRAVEMNVVKDLEDIDINITWNENSMRDFGKDELNFAKAILKKASEK